MLPSCPRCNVNGSMPMHQSCIRSYLGLDIPRKFRERYVKHPVCDGAFDTHGLAVFGPLAFYYIWTSMCNELDRQGKPVGRCPDCHEELHTRNGAILHKHPHSSPQLADERLMSADEKERHAAGLFICPHTLTRCKLCGFVDKDMMTRAHHARCSKMPDGAARKAWAHNEKEKQREFYRMMNERKEKLEELRYRREIRQDYGSDDNDSSDQDSTSDYE